MTNILHKTNPKFKNWDFFISISSRKLKISSSYLKKLICLILSELSDEIPETINQISISIISDQAIQKLNREYRAKDKATDVLSFPQNGKNWKKPLSPSLGDLVISSDTTIRQAEEFGVSIKEELLRLLIHGTLHLCGYDHEKVSQNEANKMRRKEKKIFDKLMPKM